jgi:uncharacterized protein
MDDAEALILGLGLLATGGGGLAERGRGYMRALLAEGLTVHWQPIEQLDPDTLTCSVYGMGSIAPHPPMSPDEMRAFGVDGERVSRPWVRAVDELEAYLGERIGGVIPFELGPSNTLVAVDAATRTERILVDGDYIGRALPKMSQALPAIHDLATWPLAICDPWGNALVMTDCASPAVAERIGKMVSKVTKAVDMGASCSHAAFPLTADAASRILIPGTLSRALTAGRAVIDARTSGSDPTAAAVEALGGIHLFGGVVSERTWEDSADGYMEGTTTITGTGSFSGSSARIWFLNEHHVCWVDDTPVAMSPDIIAVVTTDQAEPLSNTQIEEGIAVSVLGFCSPAQYRRGRALSATEPRHYGIDLDYLPLERLHPGLPCNE